MIKGCGDAARGCREFGRTRSVRRCSGNGRKTTASSVLEAKVRHREPSATRTDAAGKPLGLQPRLQRSGRLSRLVRAGWRRCRACADQRRRTRICLSTTAHLVAERVELIGRKAASRGSSSSDARPTLSLESSEIPLLLGAPPARPHAARTLRLLHLVSNDAAPVLFCHTIRQCREPNESSGGWCSRSRRR
jgi:hypothetical protein